MTGSEEITIIQLYKKIGIALFHILVLNDQLNKLTDPLLR